MHPSQPSLDHHHSQLCLFFLAVIVVCSSRPASASTYDTTTIVVVGTVHNKTDNYFKLQQDLSNALNQTVQDSFLRGESAIHLDAIDRFDDIGRSFGSASPKLINSNPCDVAMESKQYYAGDGMLKIVTSIPALKQCTEFAAFKRDFWIQRNDAMVTNILKWTKRLDPKTILVLCGFEHRYYLLKNLKTYRTPGAFLLREYWTY